MPPNAAAATVELPVHHDAPTPTTAITIGAVGAVLLLAACAMAVIERWLGYRRFRPAPAAVRLSVLPLTVVGVIVSACGLFIGALTTHDTFSLPSGDTVRADSDDGNARAAETASMAVRDTITSRWAVQILTSSPA